MEVLTAAAEAAEAAATPKEEAAVAAGVSVMMTTAQTMRAMGVRAKILPTTAAAPTE